MKYLARAGVVVLLGVVLGLLSVRFTGVDSEVRTPAPTRTSGQGNLQPSLSSGHSTQSPDENIESSENLSGGPRPQELPVEDPDDPPSADPSPSPSASPLPGYDPYLVDWSGIVRLDCTAAAGGPMAAVAATGDVTGDGNPEVFVVSECEASTSSWPQVLSVYSGTAGPAGPERLATLLTYDDGADARGLRNITVATSGPYVTSYAKAYDELDGNAYASLWITDDFIWDGVSFKHEDRQVELYNPEWDEWKQSQ